MKIRMTSVMVNDQDKALAFYTDKLGFEKKVEFPVGDAKWLTVVAPGEPDIELVLEPAGFPPAREYQTALHEAGIPIASFAVEGLDAEYQRLISLGVKFLSEPTQFDGDPAGPVRMAVLDDTCGNLIMIYQPPARRN